MTGLRAWLRRWRYRGRRRARPLSLAERQQVTWTRTLWADPWPLHLGLAAAAALAAVLPPPRRPRPSDARWPHLDAAWADDTGTFTAITGGQR